MLEALQVQAMEEIKGELEKIRKLLEEFLSIQKVKHNLDMRGKVSINEKISRT
jgi:hypothetical protein